VEGCTLLSGGTVAGMRFRHLAHFLRALCRVRPLIPQTTPLTDEARMAGAELAELGRPSAKRSTPGRLRRRSVVQPNACEMSCEM
jgi:hypothetical protein